MDFIDWYYEVHSIKDRLGYLGSLEPWEGELRLMHSNNTTAIDAVFRIMRKLDILNEIMKSN